MREKLRIAIDGPAASGKGTLAKQIAKKYKLLHLDSGKLYRYLAFQVYKTKHKKINYPKLQISLKKITLKKLHNKILTTEPITKIASVFSCSLCLMSELIRQREQEKRGEIKIFY